MKEINLLQIKVGSYIKLSCTIFLMFGFIFVVLGLLMGMFGGNVSFTFGTTVYKGMTAAIINVFFAPILTIFAGLLFGLFTFLPLKFFLKGIGGIKLKVKTEETSVKIT